MTSPFARFLPVFAALSAVTPACAPEGDELEFRTTCTTCGSNSPAIDDAPFPELSLSGQPNGAGVSLVGLRDPVDDDIHPLVLNGRDELVVYKDAETLLYRGDDLIGWDLVLEKDGVEVEGSITAYDGNVAPLNIGGRPITTYAVTFPDTSNPLGGAKNVCPTFVGQPNNPVLTIIRGETYDRVLKKVDLIDEDWVTFACADQAAYKAKLFGYEQGEPFANTLAPATRAQQDATLKMITADYCGTGLSFTGQGESIYWANTAGTVTAPAAITADPTKIEAVWDEDGAICLNTPRLRPRSEVDAECASIPRVIPYCNNTNWENMPHEWVTYNP